MPNLLLDYIGKSLPEWMENEDSPQAQEKKLRFFETNRNLTQKVQGRKFQPFYGNTTVFLLNDDVKESLQKLQQELYEKAGWMLAERLEKETFHMTLHDLVNSPEMNEELLERMAQAEGGAKALLKQWRDQPPLHMKTTWMFNMVNTSIVLGLAPADKESGRRLDEMYMALNQVVPLAHELTPHITMAYYRPDTYTVYDVECLRKALQPVELDITLNMEDLVFQNFYHMNGYTQQPLPQQKG